MVVMIIFQHNTIFIYCRILATYNMHYEGNIYRLPDFDVISILDISVT